VVCKANCQIDDETLYCDILVPGHKEHSTDWEMCSSLSGRFPLGHLQVKVRVAWRESD
jgi:hypothetical protein